MKFCMRVVGVRGAERIRPRGSLHNLARGVSKIWVVCLPEDRSINKVVSILQRHRKRRRDHGRKKGRGRKLLERYTSHLRIECFIPTILAPLMWKWHLNIDFTASSPFNHPQQSFDGTSILRNASRHTSEGLWWKGEGYKREGIS